MHSYESSELLDRDDILETGEDAVDVAEDVVHRRALLVEPVDIISEGPVVVWELL